MEWLTGIDETVFFQINSKWTNPFFDFLLPLFRDKYFWIPLYAALLFYLSYTLKTRVLMVLVFAILTVVLTDQSSSSIIKPMVDRLRPCNDPILADQIRLLVNCGSGKSFTSSHAANHFGIGVFLGLLFFPIKKWVLYIFLIWAFSISYAQVYVGVHYPLDILGGAILGSSIGLISYLMMKRISGNPYALKMNE